MSKPVRFSPEVHECLIPLTRAIDHLVVHLEGVGLVREQYLELARRFPEFVLLDEIVGCWPLSRRSSKKRVAQPDFHVLRSPDWPALVTAALNLRGVLTGDSESLGAVFRGDGRNGFGFSSPRPR